jgi:protein-tyrosine-phosphatase
MHGMFNVLVICTHNSARSILAESILNKHGQAILKAYSAGSSPRPNQQPHPLGLRVLQQQGHDIQGLYSKSWDIFTAPDAIAIDLVITVCDSAAGESCPLFIGVPRKVHWGYPDPSAVSGGESEQLQAFQATYEALSRRAHAFIAMAGTADSIDSLQAAAIAVKDVA